jgi:hypothetical protein
MTVSAIAHRGSAIKTLLVLVTVVLHVTASAGAQQEQEPDVALHEAPGEIVPLEMGLAAEPPPAPISLAFADAFQAGRNIHELSPVTAEAIARADQASEERFGHLEPGPQRVGLVRAIEPAALSVDRRHALSRELPDGRTLWTLAIRSPGAYALRVHVTGFDVGAGSMLLYAQAGEHRIVRGPYGGTGPDRNGAFWTPSLPGDTVFIEVAGPEDPRLEIREIGHFDRDPGGYYREGGDGTRAPDQLPCHLDAMCYEHHPGTIIPRQATGRMSFEIDGVMYTCTGTLLNDLDPDTYVPYFLTANHCLPSQDEVDTLSVRWFWQRDSCGGTLPDANTLPVSSGATLLETNPSNDMTFVRLSGSLPGGIGLAGWSTAYAPVGFGIHHPAGSWKRLTFLTNVGDCFECGFCGDLFHYDFYDMSAGVVEGGSSGSGVFNYDGQLLGQLKRACCISLSCSGAEIDCDNQGGFVAQYGEFESTYPTILRWLEMGGTIHVDGGYSGQELGTPAEPFDTVVEAYNLAWDGTRIRIAAGSYPESLTFSKQIELLAAGGRVTIGE